MPLFTLTSILLSLAFWLIVPAPQAHDFHVSRLTINHDTKHQRLEITLQTFVDDFERALIDDHQLTERASKDGRLPAAADVNLLDPKQHPRTDSLAEAYLRNHVAFRFGDGPPLPWRLVGVERGADPYAMFVYLALEAPRDGQRVRLHSTLLTDLYADQQNVVIWQRDGEAVAYDLLTTQKLDCLWSR